MGLQEDGTHGVEIVYPIHLLAILGSTFPNNLLGSSFPNNLPNNLPRDLQRDVGQVERLLYNPPIASRLMHQVEELPWRLPPWGGQAQDRSKLSSFPFGT